jgi:hypothetical protein
MLAPLPNIVQTLPARRLFFAAVAVLAAGAFIACVAADPDFFPLVNSLARDRPAYALLNDSNGSWNDALPAVANFAHQHNLSTLPLDYASLSDPALVAPQAQPWDCQSPSAADAGRWVVVAAVSILENHNCEYLLRYPHQSLAGGSMYAFQLPQPSPPPGNPAGPPPSSARKPMWGVPFDIRAFALDAERHPATLPARLETLMHQFQQQSANKTP